MNAMPKPKPRTIAGTLDRLCGDAKRLCANEHLMAVHLQHDVPAEGPRGERLGVRVTVSIELLQVKP